MEGISDIKIVGIDAQRPPTIRKEPYIDLNFELSHKVPESWAKDFNELLSKHKFPAKVAPEEGLFIATWVRTPDEVAGHLVVLKERVTECNDRCVARIVASRGAEDDAQSGQTEEGGEQGRLNRVIAGLDFDAA